MPHTTNPLAAFAEEPLGVSFEGQDPGEEIILLLRAHLITLVPYIVLTIILLLVPFFVGPILNLLNMVPAGVVLNPVQIFLLVLSWYLFVFGYAFYSFIFWYFNVYLLTNERIVDFDFKGLLHKETSYAGLLQIQDVSPKMVGFFSTFFHFGNVYIQTAAERPEFEFHHVARPDDVAHRILDEIRAEQGETPGVVA